MLLPVSTHESRLDDAFRLALFLHPDRQIALALLTRALAGLDVAVERQGKRAYYSPRPRGGLGRTFRRRVSWGNPGLLQRLIYAESERDEREREAGLVSGACSSEDLVVYYLKHLARITVRRSSFYVTLGIGRLLHEYTTAEAMQIFGLVIQDADRVKDDCYWRSRKRVLMAEMKERFERRLSVCRSERGEERFAAVEDSGPWRALVHRALDLFTPWGTTCSLPATFDPRWDLLPAFASAGVDGEDEREMRRIHALLHPDCQETLIRFLGFEPATLRLRVPRFCMSSSSGDGNRSLRPPALGEASQLRPEERKEIAALHARLATERRALRPRSLRVAVDDREVGRIHLDRGQALGFEVPARAEWLKFYASDGKSECLCAVQEISLDEGTEGWAQPFVTSVRIPDGWRLEVSLTQTSAGEPGTAAEPGPVHVGVRCERAWARAFFAGLRGWASPTAGHRFQWALASAVAAVAVGALLWRAPVPAPPPGVGGIAPPELADGRSHPGPSAPPAAPAILQTPSSPSEGGTRALPPRRSPSPVGRPQRIFLEIQGTAGPSTREFLAEALRATGTLRVAGTPEEAEVALKGRLDRLGEEGPLDRVRVRVRFVLVDPEGRVLWPADGAPFTDSGPLRDVAGRLVSRLTDEL